MFVLVITAEWMGLGIWNGIQRAGMDVSALVLTCVVEEGSDEGAVLEEGVGGGDVLKVTLFKQGVLECHGFHLEIQKPTTKPEEHLSAFWGSTRPSFSYSTWSFQTCMKFNSHWNNFGSMWICFQLKPKPALISVHIWGVISWSAYLVLKYSPWRWIWFSRVKLKVMCSTFCLMKTLVRELYSCFWRYLIMSGNHTVRP